MGEIKNIISRAKGFVGQAIDFVKDIPNKISELPFVKEFMAHPLRYGCIAAAVILLLVIITIALLARSGRGAVYANVRANGRAERRAMRRADRREDRYYRMLIRQKSREKYYLPRKRRVIYVKTKASKAQKSVQTVQPVYTPADQATIMATGLFGVGLGVMAHTAATAKKQNITF